MTAEPMVFPAAYAQQRLMIIEQLFPGTAAYHVPFAIRLRGTLDKPALTRSVEAIVARHEALRTVFTTSDGVAVQVVHPVMAVPLEELDLTGTPEAADERLLAEFLGQQARRPFDIAARLVRVTLLRLAEDEHVLAVTMHHLVSDMWSCGIFVRELAACYPALLAGEEVALPELPVQYVDYTIWQREHLGEAKLAPLVEFWRKELDGAPPVLELPGDRPRPSVQTFQGEMLPVKLSPELSRAVTALSRRLGATPFMTVLAAFKTAVGRWASSKDVVVSTGVATRTAQVEALIGCFINVVLFRTSLAGDPTFGELVGRVKRTVLDAFEHQDLPFEKLVEEIAPQRDLSHQPLTQVMFVMQNAPMPNPAIGELDVSTVHVPRHATQVDFDLQLWDGGSCYEGFIEYSADLFDPATIERMWSQFTHLLAAAVAAPDTRLSELPLLTPAELDTIVGEWNDTGAELPEVCLHELFERHARAQPDAEAVRHRDGVITYGELNARADRIAAALRAQGVGPDSVVGACFGPRPARVAAFLGILKSGGAQLPLDPGYPAERLAFMIEDARPVVVLTERAVAGRVPAGVRVLCVEDLAEAAVAEPSAVTPANLAYVIYTSGSTGRPKGICVAHRGVVNNILDLNRVGRVGPGDRLLALSSASFDMSVYDLLGPLAGGATVVLPDPDRHQDPKHWVDLVAAHGATVWNSAPALLESLVDDAAARGVRLDSLRLAFLGGDWVSVTLPERARRVTGEFRVVVLGGATEASIHSTIFEVERADPAWVSVPYGRPMDNQQVLVLDQDGNPAPVGVAGELMLGGAGLARGYLNRPALTADKFVPHPCAGRYPHIPAGARLYRTGDLARMRADGVLELLGRIDFLTKVRGFRIELGEVTAALLSHPAVAEAVVVARTDSGAEAKLVGYYVPTSGPEPTTSDLRAHIRSTLPDYMVPSAFVALDALPLSPNGKLDRKALPAPGTARPTLEAAYLAPRTPVEEVLAELWSTVLDIDRVGVRDDFFELGGYSLAATRIAALVGETFGVDVPLRAVFEAPTVAEQAAVLVAAGGEQDVDVTAIAQMALDIEQLGEDEVAALLAEQQ
ncbi:non-ribosomal peptide synthetase [Goodfellowiella coeruleoviolacea]|uniref:Amino acid adenylation domain-containing protein n=1 Tax=Goodfellowiella coeruleoviolacea TaxID=334858 RepID=A0AAE3KHY8_9PSEU|nr:amino acid adenylation domain-containing protein [Goodfellowiella coeruleoviolacea]MCP2166909.1 amino acid adenylation domain-containing protein [Goodfellowiella coeruleoviolacea]